MIEGNLIEGKAMYYQNKSMYHSEHSQDKWLNENIFKNKRDGIFVEFGALDGLLHSNSLFFEQELGWIGLCIEPNPVTFEMLRLNRKCVTENYAISTEKGKQEFIRFEGGLNGWSGLLSGIEPKHWERIDRHIPQDKRDTIDVECILLNDLLEKHKLFNIDYMSIDVEGLEFNILKTLDFDRFNVLVFDIENNFLTYPIEDLMKSKGYKKIARLDVNDIFIKE